MAIAEPGPQTGLVSAGRRIGTGLLTERGWPWLIVLPLAFLALFLLWPLATIFETALKNEGLRGSVDQTVGNGEFVEAVVRTVVLSAVVAGATWVLAVAYVLALLMAGRGLRVLLVAALVLSFWISLLVRTYAWVLALEPNGFLDKVAQWLSLTDGSLGLFQTTVGMYPAMIHIMLPYMVLPLLAAALSIDDEQLRAAEILGARPWLVLRKVVLPSMRAGTIAGVALVFLLSLGFFVTPAFLGGPSDLLIATIINQQFSQLHDFGSAAAMAGTLLLCVVVLYVVADWLFDVSAQWGRR